jgi:hypothetical protein
MSMRKAAGYLCITVVFLATSAGTALADYTDSPSPTTEVAGGGGSAGSGAGANATAFTGGDVSLAVLIAVGLVVAGVVALVVARRRMGTS